MGKGLLGMMRNPEGLHTRCWAASNPYPPGHLGTTAVRRPQLRLVGSGYLQVRGKAARGKEGASVLGHLAVAPAHLSAHTSAL